MRGPPPLRHRRCRGILGWEVVTSLDDEPCLDGGAATAEDAIRAVVSDGDRPPCDGGNALSGLCLPRAEAWSLVLTACGVPHRVRQGGAELLICVPVPWWATAVEEIRRYEEENRSWPPMAADLPSARGGVRATVLVLLSLSLFHWMSGVDLVLGHGRYVRWRQVGSADAARILDGEWWRAATALTLHADWAHLLGNAAIGGLFAAALCRELGSGLGWGLVLVSGVLGNLANALVLGAPRSSIGASTAVFGSLGVLAGLQVFRRRGHTLRESALPVGAALALLGLLGSEGERTDLGAHLFGLVSGLVLGAFAGLLVKAFGPCGPLVNRWLGASAALAPVLAWLVAIARGG